MRANVRYQRLLFGTYAQCAECALLGRPRPLTVGYKSGRTGLFTSHSTAGFAVVTATPLTGAGLSQGVKREGAQPCREGQVALREVLPERPCAGLGRLMRAIAHVIDRRRLLVGGCRQRGEATARSDLDVPVVRPETASSSAVTAGINAKNAFCFALSGRGPASRHTDRLGQARPVGRCRESCALKRHRRADRQRLHHPAKGASFITEDGVSAAGAVWPDDRGRIQVDPVPFGVAVS
jgi:hypothetical protein